MSRQCPLEECRPVARGAVGLCVFVLLFGGCGADKGPKLASVSGTVTLDGLPVQGAVLEFVPQEAGKSTAFGATDENGFYEMQFGQSRHGAFLGRTKVRIRSDDQVFVGGENYSNTEVFPPRYNDRSELFVDVADGENEFDFPCESGNFKRRQRSLSASD
jgi:hypothetical protein